ncbi:MAG: hypothetical protein ACYTAS_07105 [Planctomycetota bacterium]|jgi:hypothetical protein
MTKKKTTGVEKKTVMEKKTGVEADKQGFRPEKAKGELKLIAEWLTARTRQEKLVAVLSGELLRHAHVLNNEGLYEGDIANEVLNTWEQELEENDPDDGPEMQFARGYCMALSRMSS